MWLRAQRNEWKWTQCGSIVHSWQRKIVWVPKCINQNNDHVQYRKVWPLWVWRVENYSVIWNSLNVVQSKNSKFFDRYSAARITWRWHWSNLIRSDEWSRIFFFSRRKTADTKLMDRKFVGKSRRILQVRKRCNYDKLKDLGNQPAGIQYLGLARRHWRSYWCSVLPISYCFRTLLEIQLLFLHDEQSFQSQASIQLSAETSTEVFTKSSRYFSFILQYLLLVQKAQEL